MAIEFACSCGRRIEARDNQAGARYRCPSCGASLVVPVSPWANSPGKIPPPPPQACRMDRPIRFRTAGALPARPTAHAADASGIARLLLTLFAAWALLVLLCLLVMAALPAGIVLGVMLLLAGSGLAFGLVVQLLLAKQRALRQKDVPVLLGLARIVAWDPTEGVLFLKDKTVSCIDDDVRDGGGIRVIYPVLGEELALCMPLEPQSLLFEDCNVLTREYLPLSIRGTIKWKVADLMKFYHEVSREVHTATDHDAYAGRSAAYDGRGMTAPAARSPFGAADGARVPQHAARQKHQVAMEWLRWIAEEETRTIVSRVSAGLLVAEQVASDLPSEARQVAQDRVFDPVALLPSAGAEYRSATEGLAGAIQHAILAKAVDYGIEVREVSLQDVRLPQAVYEKCVEACRSAYTPMIGEREAAARKARLQADADVLGMEAVAAREVVRHAPAFTIADFLAQFLSQNAGLAQLASKGAPKQIGGGRRG